MHFDKEYLEKAVKEGIDRNIICFDGEAKVGEFTYKLFEIMTVCMLKNKCFEHDELKYVVSPVLPIDYEEKFHQATGYFYDIEIFHGHDFTDFLLNVEGEHRTSLAPQDIKLVIGIGKNGNVILGSY